jgi:MFS family permease
MGTRQEQGESRPDLGARRWLIVGIGVAGQAATCCFLYGLSALVPALRATEHVSLATAGAIVAAPVLGLIVCLIGWGALSDRYSERAVMSIGVGLAGVLLLAAQWTRGTLELELVFALAGAAAASIAAASGRVVLGWFAADERGLAMGLRQTAQPIGVALGALALPPLAHAYGFREALLFPALLCVVIAVAIGIFVIDPPRAPRAAGVSRPPSPYRVATLWRVHAASALLVVPQMTVTAFGLEFLVTTQHWSATAAGWLVGAIQGVGAAGRIGIGRLSDRLGSRLRPMRVIAVAAAVVMLALALGDVVSPPLAIVALLAAYVVTVTDNGLGFTSTAEMAGPEWAGRALGVQNTGQNIASFLTPTLTGALIGATGYASTFALVAIFPVLGVFIVPVRGETLEPLSAATELSAGLTGTPSGD